MDRPNLSSSSPNYYENINPSQSHMSIAHSNPSDFELFFGSPRQFDKVDKSCFSFKSFSTTTSPNTSPTSKNYKQDSNTNSTKSYEYSNSRNCLSISSSPINSNKSNNGRPMVLSYGCDQSHLPFLISSSNSKNCNSLNYSDNPAKTVTLNDTCFTKNSKSKYNKKQTYQRSLSSTNYNAYAKNSIQANSHSEYLDNKHKANINNNMLNNSSLPNSSKTVITSNSHLTATDRSRKPITKLSLPLRTGSEPPIGRRRMVPAPVSIDLPYTPSPSTPTYCHFSPEDIDRRYEDMLQMSGRLTLDSQTSVFCPREDIKFEYELGQGICGVVSKATHLPSNRAMAVKVMRRIGNSPEEHKRVIMDLEVVAKCHDCRHIVRCFGIFIFPSEVWICMELMATCLDRLLRQVGPLPEHILGKIVIPILRALHYLKEKHNIIHRDVKPSNFLLNDSGRVKLCDFGISGLLENSHAKTRTAGCTAYLSPERITLSGPYDIRSDIWSLGISLVELATGKHPLKDCHTEMEMLTRIVDEPPPCLPQNTSFTDHFRDFVSRCLTKDVNYRPKYHRLLTHDFIRYHEQTQTNLAEWLAEVRNASTPAGGVLQPPRRLSAGSCSSSSGYGSVDTSSPSSQQSRSPGALQQSTTTS